MKEKNDINKIKGTGKNINIEYYNYGFFIGDN